MAVRAPYLACSVGPGMLVAPPPAQPSPAPGRGSGSGNSCAGEAERVQSERPNLALEPVATWTPWKVAAWLRGGWGRGSAGPEGPWAGESGSKKDVPSLSVG